MNSPQIELERRLLKRQKKQPSKLEDDSIIDWEIIPDFIASALFHIFLAWILWSLLLIYYEPSYNKMTTTKKIKDIVFYLKPNKTQKK